MHVVRQLIVLVDDSGPRGLDRRSGGFEIIAVFIEHIDERRVEGRHPGRKGERRPGQAVISSFSANIFFGREYLVDPLCWERSRTANAEREGVVEHEDRPEE